MDGRQGVLKQSLQFRLSVWLSLIIVVGAMVASTFSFITVFQEALELQDDQLQQMVALIERQHWSITQTKLQTDGSEPESRIVVQRLGEAGELPGLPMYLPDGLQTVTIEKLSWRVLVKTLTSGSRMAIAQRTDERDEIAHDSALRTLVPFLILIPILLVLVSDLIHKMFHGLTKIALDLDQRSERDLQEITDSRLPSEIRPFVLAINQLLGRVAQSVAVQHRFVADAAHELRSPLTALSLQAERLEAAEMSIEARDRLMVLRKGLHRTQGLLEQLLTLARVQSETQEPTEPVSLQFIFRQVLADLMPLAEAKRLDLGVVSTVDAYLVISEADLNIVLRNLVDNAIRYTPEGGQIDLSIQITEGSIILQVADTGPGIPVTEWARVFDPFYRLLGHDVVGSGLGVSIVQTVVARVGATIQLSYANEEFKSGLCVTVIFPGESYPFQTS